MHTNVVHLAWLLTLSLLTAGNCLHDKRETSPEVQEDDLTKVLYSLGELKEKIVSLDDRGKYKPRKRIKELQKAISERNSMWNQEMATPGWQLWEYYRKQYPNQEKNPSIKALKDLWGQMLKNPSEEIAHKLKESLKTCEEQKQTDQYLQSTVLPIFNNTPDIRLTEPMLAYMEYLEFILNEKVESIYSILKKGRDRLKQWQKDNNTTGMTLWKAACQNPCLKAYVPKDTTKIMQCLEKVEQWAQDPYQLTVDDLCITMWKGLRELDCIFEKITDLDENKELKQLQGYMKIIKKNLRGTR